MTVVCLIRQRWRISCSFQSKGKGGAAKCNLAPSAFWRNGNLKTLEVLAAPKPTAPFREMAQERNGHK